MRTWTFDEARPPGVGPWNDEPDKAQWVDEKTGLDCLIVRNSYVGNLCGYVGIPPGHPWHGKGPWKLDACAHGDRLNFAGRCQEGGEEQLAVCHVPEPGRPADVWWLGFHCAHARDFCPTVYAHLAGVLGEAGVKFMLDEFSAHKTFAYVQVEVTELAAQVAKVK